MTDPRFAPDINVVKDSTEKSEAESAAVMAEGIAAILGPVVRDFDARVEGALKSQSLLTGSIDRLTKGATQSASINPTHLETLPSPPIGTFKCGVDF